MGFLEKYGNWFILLIGFVFIVNGFVSLYVLARSRPFISIVVISVALILLGFWITNRTIKPILKNKASRQL